MISSKYYNAHMSTRFSLFLSLLPQEMYKEVQEIGLAANSEVFFCTEVNILQPGAAQAGPQKTAGSHAASTAGRRPGAVLVGGDFGSGPLPPHTP